MNPLVTPHPSPEAVALMRYLRSASGKQALTGQHCAPLVDSTRLVTGKRVTIPPFSARISGSASRERGMASISASASSTRQSGATTRALSSP